MPKSTAMGMYLAGFAFILGFAAIWHIWWLAIASFALIIALTIKHLSSDDTHYYVPAAEVEKIEKALAKRQRH